MVFCKPFKFILDHNNLDKIMDTYFNWFKMFYSELLVFIYCYLLLCYFLLISYKLLKYKVCVYTYISQLSLVKTRPSCHFEVPFISTKCVNLQLKHVHFWNVSICLIWVVFWVFAAAFTTSWLDYSFVVVTDINVSRLQCEYLLYLFA